MPVKGVTRECQDFPCPDTSHRFRKLVLCNQRRSEIKAYHMIEENTALGVILHPSHAHTQVITPDHPPEGSLKYFFVFDIVALSHNGSCPFAIVSPLNRVDSSVTYAIPSDSNCKLLRMTQAVFRVALIDATPISTESVHATLPANRSFKSGDIVHVVDRKSGFPPHLG